MSRCVRHIRAAVVTCFVTSSTAPQVVGVQESLSSQSELASQHPRLGMREVDSGRFLTARPRFQAAIAADPSWGYAHLQLFTSAANAAERRAHRSHAIEHLATATVSERLLIEAVKQAADRHQPGPLASLAKLVVVAPDDPRGWMLHAQGGSIDRRAAEAPDSRAKAGEVAPDDIPTLAAAGQTDTRVPRDSNTAERDAHRFQELEPRAIRATTLTRFVRTVQGHFANAIATYATRATLDPSSTPLALRAAPRALKSDSKGARGGRDLAYTRTGSDRVLGVAERRIVVHALRGDSASAAKTADRGDADARRAEADAGLFANIGLSSQHLEKGFTSMFNGKNLSGWDGATEFWTVQDGAIVGETKKTSPQTIFLYWTGGEPADFEMRCRFRISGTEANSGIQIRSQRVPEWDAIGYQADFDVSGYSVGNLYLFGRKPLATFAQRGDSVRIDSSGNRTVSNFANPATLLDAYKRGDWNDYWIIAKGRSVTVRLNGVLMTTVEDHEHEYFSRKGIIALQLHSGEPMRVEFKDLRIRQYGG